MRKWLAGKLFDWAVSLDWDKAVDRARLVVFIETGVRAWSVPAPKRGRPKGSKDGVGKALK